MKEFAISRENWLTPYNSSYCGMDWDKRIGFCGRSIATLLGKVYRGGQSPMTREQKPEFEPQPHHHHHDHNHTLIISIIQ